VLYWSRAVLDGVASLEAPQVVPPAECQALAARARAFADAMRFEFLYDRRRRLFAIGYRVSDADGPGRFDGSFYDLLASEARLAASWRSPKATWPQSHWFHLGRLVTNVNGQATLMSWGGTMFEYLMPQLLMRSFAGTLLDRSCHAAVQRQIDYAHQRRVPWGISESAYAFTDRDGVYQYRAFGVPGLGLRRGLVDDLVIRAVRHGALQSYRSVRSGRQPRSARRARGRRALRVLRIARLQPARSRGRSLGERTAGADGRACLLLASPGDVARGAGQRRVP
jgi:hypothetical protein